MTKSIPGELDFPIPPRPPVPGEIGRTALDGYSLPESADTHRGVLGPSRERTELKGVLNRIIGYRTKTEVQKSPHEEQILKTNTASDLEIKLADGSSVKAEFPGFVPSDYVGKDVMLEIQTSIVSAGRAPFLSPPNRVTKDYRFGCSDGSLPKLEVTIRTYNLPI